MKKSLVIGGSGFLGSHVSDCLSQNGFKVTIYDIKKSKWLRKDQKMIIGNISNDKRLEQAIKGNSFVYNFAAISDIDFASERPRETVEVNILGTARILEKCLKLKKPPPSGKNCTNCIWNERVHQFKEKLSFILKKK